MENGTSPVSYPVAEATYYVVGTFFVLLSLLFLYMIIYFELVALTMWCEACRHERHRQERESERRTREEEEEEAYKRIKGRAMECI